MTHARFTQFEELTRHFVEALFRPAFLGDHGAEALRKLLGLLAAATAGLGLFMPLPLFKKYIGLSVAATAVPYQQALVADQILLLALPMIIVGLAMSVVAPSLYLDDTDFLVLSPLPVGRGIVFAAKLAAVTVFILIFAVAINTLGNLWFPMISGGRWATDSFVERAAAHTAASLLATLFVPLALAAVQGASVALLPRRAAATVSTIVHAAVFCGLIVAIPVVLRLPGRLDPAPWMQFVPPCWFMGTGRYLLGDPHPMIWRLHLIAMLAVTAATLTVLGCYLASYLQYGRTAPVVPRPRARPSRVSALARRVRPSVAAGIAFIAATVTRSRLNVLILAGVWAIGLERVVNLFLGGRQRSPAFLPPDDLIYRAIAPSLIVALTTVMGFRAAFLIPVDRHANWVFRLTEVPETRSALLRSVESVLAITALTCVLLIGVPLQLFALGALRTALATPLVVLVTLILVEAVMRNWQRVPFTCSYIPGKRHLSYFLVTAWLAYVIFVMFAGLLIASAVLFPPRLLMATGTLLAIYAWMRRRRLGAFTEAPLEFEDELPEAIRSLGLRA